ncbi:hypothetical protein NEUTE2DRAFT_69854 [Neurospora tetrasperma FGSC 2509]|nr:hypothetical protein NEUTE2DRAFT_69854 [Neurospora tetrasperma FGSC 2509]
MATSLHALRQRLPSDPVALGKKVDAFSERMRFRLWLLTGHREMPLYPQPGGELPFSKVTTTTSLVVLMAEPHFVWCLPTWAVLMDLH